MHRPNLSRRPLAALGLLLASGFAAPASFAISSVHAPSPKLNAALMPSSRACLTIGPPVASMPP